MKNPSKEELEARRSYQEALDAWFVPVARDVYPFTAMGYAFTEDAGGNLVGNFYEEKDADK